MRRDFKYDADENILQELNISNPSCGYYVPIGWQAIVESCLRRMVTVGWNRELHQVKEKFGGLRIYIGKTSAEIENLICEAESAACKTCQVCSQPGKVKAFDGLLATVCEKCSVEHYGSAGKEFNWESVQ